LTSLKGRNERSNTANGNVVDTLHPDKQVVIKELEEERARIHKMDCSAVMPTHEITDSALDLPVTKISDMIQGRPIVNNKMNSKSDISNGFYQALTQQTARQANQFSRRKVADQQAHRRAVTAEAAMGSN